MAPRRDEKVLRQVADRIREIRKELKITQTTVFEDTSINIGNIESSPLNLTITSIVILCDYFEVSLEEFFRGIGNQYTI
jgi:transcriptional regulator with XRE-family HTH domain